MLGPLCFTSIPPISPAKLNRSNNHPKHSFCPKTGLKTIHLPLGGAGWTLTTGWCFGSGTSVGRVWIMMVLAGMPTLAWASGTAGKRGLGCIKGLDTVWLHLFRVLAELFARKEKQSELDQKIYRTQAVITWLSVCSFFYPSIIFVKNRHIWSQMQVTNDRIYRIYNRSVS